ncbi:allophanate hydrolase [Xaviernesmea oryzae]|uniref:Allophanate hydrolase n=1 Tax=Xaviernesmea oryzae TaxID=464029 RepID=A0A1Q9B0V9_9HYPH|nr:allophanate hydrolase [Xaviernesmea oryzae]OLP61619.1 allophanate hydrolase [Xaviernesmea oryzae]SEL06085.1 allophanate hydrolase [Xaviernesmea oryzae]
MSEMLWSDATGSLDLTTLSRAYKAGTLTPSRVVNAIYDRIAARGEDHVWIHLVSREDALATARALEAEGHDGRPLWGIPFSVKDCNDIVGLPTTNALKEAAYVATSSGQALDRLFEAGAVLIGKTNMDQFGIGLVGMRTPYGACSSVFDERYISGGSSSGSGVSVAAGLCSFSIANDAAGSGRVPAGFNNIVGIKPTPGLVSNACVSGGGCVKTIETLSVFSLTVEDGMAVLDLMAGYDPSYPFSKPEADDVVLTPIAPPSQFRFGVPKGAALRFFGDGEAERLFNEAVARLVAMGGEKVEVDFAPFEETQRILYEGPWISERALSLDKVLDTYRDAIHPVTREILSRSGNFSALDTFAAIHRIAELKRDTRPVWDDIAVLMVPTTPTIYTKAEIAENPIQLNSNLGIYTNFVNLMGLCGIAVPNGFRADGLPLGVTFLAPGFAEARAAGIAAAFHRATGLSLAKFDNPYPPAEEPALPNGYREIAVVGAHLSGMPLNHELVERGGIFRRSTTTRAAYRLFALGGTVPPKPALIRVADEGVAIAVEVWALPVAGFGDFIGRIPAPLGVGKLALEDGSEVTGFLCEGAAVAGQADISHFGGWRAYRAAGA